jgi:hypothetical protein
MKNTTDEAQNLLGCSAVILIECRPTFQWYVLPPSSGLIALVIEAARIPETSVDIQVRTRHYIPEDSELHTRRRENLKSHKDNRYSNWVLRSELQVLTATDMKMAVFCDSAPCSLI